ncbi:MAG: hypothetical protein HYX61_02525 [Gammaproteobacteria bacterium]|jgi:hypothetical protein|nr:hypothetical protein [Gammaproteobacteria bacterium]
MTTGFFNANNLHAQQLADERRANEIKKFEEITKKRIAQRKAVRPPKNQHPHEGGILAKFDHLNDLNPNSLIGYALTAFFFKLLELAFHTNFLIQKRDFNKAKQIDAAKEMRGEDNDDHIRLAYQQRKNKDGTLMFDAQGKPVFPAVFQADEAGNIDYHRKPNTDGTADRFSIRANGFVPQENLYESYLTLKDELLEEWCGKGELSPEQRLRLHLELETEENKHKDKSGKDFAADNVVANPAARAAAMSRKA